MNDSQLESEITNLKSRLSSVEKELDEIHVKYDLKADRAEKADPKSNAKAISDAKASLEHLGDMSTEVMLQMKKTFEENYDERTQTNIEDLRQRDPKNNQSEINKFDFKKEQYRLICEELKRRNAI